jgi:DNA modification methylase
MGKLGPYDLDSIVTGDCRELASAIPDESVDLIFTDPPYPREFLSLYGWLAETAARVLKPGALCVAMCGQSYLPDIYAMMTRHLTYRWTCSLELAGPTCAIMHRRVSTSWKPLLVYSKGKSSDWLTMDRIPSFYRDKSLHVWQQDANSAQFFIKAATGVIWEPFCGSGTTPAACKMLGRHYLAFEIDPIAAETARERVHNTQPPLIVPEPEQPALFMEVGA